MLFLCPYATLFCWSWRVFFFSENQPKYIEVLNFSFILPWHRFDSRSTSVGQLQKYAARAKTFCFPIRPVVSLL